MFSLLGLFFVAMGFLIQFGTVIWQVVESFRGAEGKGWGIASIFGVLCLGLIPNLLWAIINWDRGWPMVVAWIGGLPPILMGFWLMWMEAATTL